MTSLSNFIKLQRLIGSNTSHIFYKTVRNNVDYLSYGHLKYRSFHTSSSWFKRRKTSEERKLPRMIEYPQKAKGDIIGVWHNITAKELGEVLNRDFDYVRQLFLNQIHHPQTVLSDIKVIQQAIRRSGNRMKTIARPDSKSEKKIIEKDAYPRPPPDKSQLKPRPPIVTVMGHVDHGKTTLLDALRHSSVVEQEFGGITQHIGAFSVVLDSGARITFLDTPGHAAFTAMRARGAYLTDIVVLVVAADDGVMEQTIESIRMAREANVPILVAINKIDSPKADIKRTEMKLMENGIHIEKFGGDTQAVPISALKRQNLEQLTEALVLQAELLEVGGDPSGLVEAMVVESKVDPHRGKLCTIIVQRGTLKKGKILVAGTAMAKVRVLRDAEGKIMNEVTPGYPTEVEGWRDLPAAGEQVLEVESERQAKDVIEIREDKLMQEKSEQDAKIIAEKEQHHYKQYRERLEMKRKLGRLKLRPEGPRKPEVLKDENPIPTLNIVLKADVDGTLEAILNTLDTYDSPICEMDLVHYGVGAITPNDIELAKTFEAIIYAFNVNCPEPVKSLAENQSVEIKHYNVIYKLVDDVKEEINSRLPNKEVEEVIGEATILQQFDINDGRKKVPVAGCRCTKGLLRKSAMYKLIRNDQVVHVGTLSAMRHLKDDVDTIKTDTECGLQLSDKSITFQPGDILQCYQMKNVAQTTEWDPGF